MSADNERGYINIKSMYGDMKVVVLLPGPYNQTAHVFHPEASLSEMETVDRRDLAIIRAMLQDALDNVDEERNRRIRAQAEAAYASPPPQIPVPPRPAGW